MTVIGKAQRTGEKQLKLWGEAAIRISDLGIKNPAPRLAHFRFEDKVILRETEDTTP